MQSANEFRSAKWNIQNHSDLEKAPITHPQSQTAKLSWSQKDFQLAQMDTLIHATLTNPTAWIVGTRTNTMFYCLCLACVLPRRIVFTTSMVFDSDVMTFEVLDMCTSLQWSSEVSGSDLGHSFSNLSLWKKWTPSKKPRWFGMEAKCPLDATFETHSMAAFLDIPWYS